MSFTEKRQEIKIFSENLGELKNQILILKAKKYYNKRKVVSLYYDTFDLENYYNGIEGLVPREKIRIRCYENFATNKPCKLETKKTFEHYREKNIINLKRFNNTDISQIILNKKKKNYTPILFVEYEREYYLTNDVRLTLDTNIKYKKYSSNQYFKDYRNVLEFKFIGIPDHNLLEKKNKREFKVLKIL